MTTEQYIATLDRRLSDLAAPGLIASAASQTHAPQLNRIFEEGIKASGKIGAYAVTPMYANVKQFSTTGAFHPVGKPVQRILKNMAKSKKSRPVQTAGLFKNGKQRRSMYLANGYRQLKSIQGLQASFVNLTYTADLKNDLAQNLVTTEGGFASGVTSPNNAEKIAGLLSKYGNDLFALTNDEKHFFKTAVAGIVRNCLTAHV